MTIETKYNIGDSVWFMSFELPIKVVIESLLFVKDSEIERTMYAVVNPNNGQEYDAVEEELFPTKEELLKSL